MRCEKKTGKLSSITYMHSVTTWIGWITVSKSIRQYTIRMVKRKMNVSVTTPWHRSRSETELFLGSIWEFRGGFSQNKANNEEPLLKFYQRFWLNNIHSQRTKHNATKQEETRHEHIWTNWGKGCKKRKKTVRMNFIIPLEIRDQNSTNFNVLHSVDFVLFFTFVDMLSACYFCFN